MRLVEKKCPNCGGELKFSFEDKETTCEFCGRSFEIERDEKIADDNEEMFNADNYALTEEAKKVAGAVLGSFAAAQVIPIVIIGIIFVGVFVVVGVTQFKGHDVQNGSLIVEKQEKDEVEDIQEEVKKTAEEKLKEQGYVMSFEDLKENHLKDFHENTLSMLNDQVNKRYKAFLYSHGNWSYVGMYLLTDSSGNSIFDVYKINFKINGKAVTYFGAVEYDNAKITDGKLVVNMDGRLHASLNMTMSSNPKDRDTLGYESAKDLYNKLIRGMLSSSTMHSIGSVYKE